LGGVSRPFRVWLPCPFPEFFPVGPFQVVFWNSSRWVLFRLFSGILPGRSFSGSIDETAVLSSWIVVKKRMITLLKTTTIQKLSLPHHVVILFLTTTSMIKHSDQAYPVNAHGDHLITDISTPWYTSAYEPDQQYDPGCRQAPASVVGV